MPNTPPRRAHTPATGGCTVGSGPAVETGIDCQGQNLHSRSGLLCLRGHGLARPGDQWAVQAMPSHTWTKHLGKRHRLDCSSRLAAQPQPMGCSTWQASLTETNREQRLSLSCPTPVKHRGVAASNVQDLRRVPRTATAHRGGACQNYQQLQLNGGCQLGLLAGRLD